jgi:hypothetical protein
MANVPFSFPVLHIAEPTGENDGSWLDTHVNSNPFTIGDRRKIRAQVYVGDIIMDAEGRTWRLLKLIDLGQSRDSFLGWLGARMFGSHDIRYELSDELNLSFSKIKDRIGAMISADPESYVGEAATEDGSLSEEQWMEQVRLFAQKVRNAVSPIELIAIVDYNSHVIWPATTS